MNSGLQSDRLRLLGAPHDVRPSVNKARKWREVKKISSFLQVMPRTVNAIEEDLQCSVCHLPLKEPLFNKMRPQVLQTMPRGTLILEGEVLKQAGLKILG